MKFYSFMQSSNDYLATTLLLSFISIYSFFKSYMKYCIEHSGLPSHLATIKLRTLSSICVKAPLVPPRQYYFFSTFYHYAPISAVFMVCSGSLMSVIKLISSSFDILKAFANESSNCFRSFELNVGISNTCACFKNSF